MFVWKIKWEKLKDNLEVLPLKNGYWFVYQQVLTEYKDKVHYKLCMFKGCDSVVLIEETSSKEYFSRNKDEIESRIKEYVNMIIKAL